MADVAEMRGVSKRFGDFAALDAIDLTVSTGVIRGFLGPNGAGKTTAMRILVGLLRSSGGDTRVFGGDPWSEPAVRADIGFLPSDPGFYGRMTGRGLLDHFAALSQREPVLREHACLHLRMSEADLGRQVRHYSKGMRQKLGILQAVQHDPQLLIMDEPGEGLDPLVLNGLITLLRERRDAGRAILFSSHVLAEVEALCDEVTMIRGGRIIGEGTIGELAQRRSRHLVLELEDPALQIELPGAEAIDSAGTRRTFAHHGPIQPLLAALAALPVVDVKIQEASLDEVFMEYYGDASHP
ncbi:MAG: ABC transporter ATP-binding protein [Gaiellales bacterium]